MKKIILIFILFLTSIIYSQVDEIYTVNSTNLNVRSGPSTQYSITHRLTLAQDVLVISVHNRNWYEIDLGYGSGYVYSKFLIPNYDWEKKYLTSGSDPKCFNYKKKYDNEIDNYLQVNVGSNTDVVIKLMQINNYGDDRCIRFVYVRSNDSYKIRNIPENNYYLKIAYGKDWRQKIVNDKCIGKFVKRAMYEKGDEILDFNLVHTSDGYNIPLYELFLEVVETDSADIFHTNQISETEFNE